MIASAQTLLAVRGLAAACALTLAGRSALAEAPKSSAPEPAVKSLDINEKKAEARAKGAQAKGDFFHLKTLPVKGGVFGGKSITYLDTGLATISGALNELAPGEHSIDHHHDTEALIVIVSGRGHSLLHAGSEPKKRLDWSEGDLLVIPSMMWHEHFNDATDQPVRFIAIYNGPLLDKVGAKRFFEEAVVPAPAK